MRIGLDQPAARMSAQPLRRVAVVGSGIAGLGVAHALAGCAHVTLYESAKRFGGHSHTVDVTVGAVTHPVDTGFLVLNERTYPNLLRLYARLGVELAPSEMSFSVQVREQDLEWSGADFAGVFAQRRNAIRPRFWRMLTDVLRFNRLATRLAQGRPGMAEGLPDQSIGDFLDQHRFSRPFRDWYFLPMIGAIWSCSTDQMLDFPVATLIRFCDNHGLIQIANRPQWYTVRGGARRYVAKMLAAIPDARLDGPVRRVARSPAEGRGTASVLVTTDSGTECFDDVVMACHSDQSLALLADPTLAEREVLGAIRYQSNRAVLHTDSTLLPQRRGAWAAWNYEHAAGAAHGAAPVCLHYLINRLQPLPFDAPVIVSLNPVRQPRPNLVQGEFDYEHPVFDAGAIAAQSRVPYLQGIGNVWYCGAWTRYGFHEDGLVSALAVCAGLHARWGSAQDGAVNPIGLGDADAGRSLDNAMAGAACIDLTPA